MPDRYVHRAGEGPVRYRIVVRGSIGDDLFRLLDIVSVGDAEAATILYCGIVDQARLQAILGWLHAEGVELVRAEAVEGEA